MYYVYVLQRKKRKEWYIGYTEDLKRRVKEHSIEYPCELVYYEAYSEERLARERERKLKSYGSAWRALKGRIIKRAG